jgi:hypothetical protein
MSDASISRRSRTFDITLSTSTALATTLDLKDMAAAVVEFGTMSTSATSLRMFGSDTQSGTYFRLYKADGTAADLTLAPSTTEGRIYSLPDEVFALPFLKIVSATTVTTGVSGVVCLKS